MKNNYLMKIFALVFVFAQVEKSVAQYTVSPIPHQAYTAGLPVGFSIDDVFSEPFALGFDFTFFGASYNQVQLSTNGYLTFNQYPANIGGWTPWSFNTSIPNADFPVKNSFFGCYHDLNNVTGTGIQTYAVTGTAPFRKFVVIFQNVPQFSCGQSAVSSFQMILYETLDILDVQIVERQVCAAWNQGNALVGVINTDGTVAFTPPGRNTGSWTAAQEGWRFDPGTFSGNAYRFIKCDPEQDGFESFDLAVAQNDLWPANPAGVTFHASAQDALGQESPLSISYTNLSLGHETIYANVNGQVKTIALSLVDCDTDYDDDTVATADEDVNNDTNLANDDTDNDGIPDFIDNDDDGDLVLTSEEYVFARNANALLDTDGDGTPNYLDNDDDGDGVLTIDEDYNGNNNPADDDTNNNGIPDYLESAVALGVNQNRLQSNSLSLYPNPASSLLNIDNKSGKTISNVAIFTINGALVKQLSGTQIGSAIAVEQLQSGMYFVKITLDGAVENYKFIKK